MKPNLLLLFAIILVTEILSAQIPPVSQSNSPAQAASVNVLAPGTLLSVELSKSLDAKKLKPNDKFEARTALDLLSHGQIVIPRNTRIIGRVTDAKAHSKQSPDSLLGIAFERVMLKDGRELPLRPRCRRLPGHCKPRLQFRIVKTIRWEHRRVVSLLRRVSEALASGQRPAAHQFRIPVDTRSAAGRACHLIPTMPIVRRSALWVRPARE